MICLSCRIPHTTEPHAHVADHSTASEVHRHDREVEGVHKLSDNMAYELGGSRGRGANTICTMNHNAQT